MDTSWGNLCPVSEEVFDTVQLILDGRRPSALPKSRQRARPEFPLKGFARCARCADPLTGEAKKGGRFHYYRCRTPGWIGTIAKAKLENAFAALLDSLRPRPGNIRLFREIVLREHRQAHQTKGCERRRLEQRRDDLQQQRRNLGRELARGIIDSNSYRELRDEIDAELAEVRVAIPETTMEEIDVEGVLDFAEELFLNPAKMWRQLRPAAKHLFQSSIFPEGVTFDGEFCRTPVTASFLAGLQDLEGAETRMASPMSPSSNSWGWITRLGALREGLLEAA